MEGAQAQGEPAALDKEKRGREVSEEVIVTNKFVRNAKHLYRTAIHATKAWRTYADAPTIENIAQVGRHFRLLHKALTRVNYDIDPLAEGGAK